MADPVQPSADVIEHDQKVHALLAQITQVVASIPGVTEVEMVAHRGDWAAWGFMNGDMPCSLAWNVTP